MKYLFLLYLNITCIIVSGNAQEKVAQYSVGKYGTRDYEHICFRTRKGKRTQIEYSYGSHPKEMRLAFLGKFIQNGKTGIKVQFPNKHILLVFPNETDLLIKDKKGKYVKTFKWEYEGPVNGIGTFCKVCAANEEEAMEIVKGVYLK
jgi:hypothetical protein